MAKSSLVKVNYLQHANMHMQVNGLVVKVLVKLLFGLVQISPKAFANILAQNIEKNIG